MSAVNVSVWGGGARTASAVNVSVGGGGHGTVSAVNVSVWGGGGHERCQLLMCQFGEGGGGHGTVSAVNAGTESLPTAPTDVVTVHFT